MHVTRDVGEYCGDADAECPKINPECAEESTTDTPVVFNSLHVQVSNPYCNWSSLLTT